MPALVQIASQKKSICRKCTRDAAYTPIPYPTFTLSIPRCVNELLKQNGKSSNDPVLGILAESGYFASTDKIPKIES